MHKVTAGLWLICALVHGQSAASAYTGSSACQPCHPAVYERWKRTRMANVVRDPHIHPDAILPDLSKPDPLVTFKKDDIAFVYGSKWKQRYFTKVGDDYYPLGAQWDITHQIWRPYMSRRTPTGGCSFYPADNMKRPTGPLCDGCHSVNYNIQTKRSPSGMSAAKSVTGRAAIMSHSPAQPTSSTRRAWTSCVPTTSASSATRRASRSTIRSRDSYYDWPVGFDVGMDLRISGSSKNTSSARQTFTHFRRRHRAQESHAGQRLRAKRHVHARSDLLQLPRRSRHRQQRRPGEAGNELCLQCHGPNSPNGPHVRTIDEHTHHKAGSAGQRVCRVPHAEIEQTIADVNVRSHTFRFITPAMTETYKIPNPCNLCHADKSMKWAADALSHWHDRSPWRMQN